MRNQRGLIILGFVFLFSCSLKDMAELAPNGHGSISEYEFSINKNVLESKIDSLINIDESIRRKESDSNQGDNYNNINPYFTLITGNIEFCFRYYGDSTDWSDSDTISKIFLVSTKTLKGEPSEECSLEIIENHFISKLR